MEGEEKRGREMRKKLRKRQGRERLKILKESWEESEG